MGNIAWMSSTSREGGLIELFLSCLYFPFEGLNPTTSHFRSLVSSSTSLVLPFCSPLHLPGPGWSLRGHTLSPVLSEGFYILSARQSVVPWGGSGCHRRLGEERHICCMPQEGTGRELGIRRVSVHTRKVHAYQEKCCFQVCIVANLTVGGHPELLG